MKKIYIWYSGATDVTGKNLVEGLTEKLDSDAFEVSGGTAMPENNVDVVICYGTKTQSDTELGSNVKVLNHPNNIRVNRNKLTALEKMSGGNVNIPQFSKLPAGARDSEITYPVIVRTSYHQGGRGLAMCTSSAQVLDLITNFDNVGFGYIQELVPFKNEYRIHVFNGKVIRCAIKDAQENPVDSWKTIYKEKAERTAERNNIELNADTMDILLKTVAKDLTLPDLIVKSNKKGWKFSQVSIDNTNPALIEMAKKAVSAIGLDFGAVDCALDYDGKAWVIEVNTGPGLQGGTLTSYIKALEGYVNPPVTRSQTPTRQSSNHGAGVAPNRPDTGMREELNSIVMAMTEMTSSMTARVEALTRQINRNSG
jgi:glutathione synthase/RimK-type ligase-like ATP-grasp enzyme